MRLPSLSRNQRFGLAGAALLALGGIGGAGAVALTRPAVEIAPTVVTPIARLSATNGLVTVRGRVAEIYGDRLLVQDGTGRTLVAIGHEEATGISRGSPLLVQGRFDDGQLRARFLVDASGQAREVGPGGDRRGHGRGYGGRHGSPSPAIDEAAPPAPATQVPSSSSRS